MAAASSIKNNADSVTIWRRPTPSACASATSNPVLAHHPHLDELSQAEITEQGDQQNRPELPGQGHEAQRSGERRKWQKGADAHDQDGRHAELPTGPGLNEGYLVGADDMDDERLGHDGFHEPAGVKEGGGVGV